MTTEARGPTVGDALKKRGGLRPMRKGAAVERLVVLDQERMGRVAFRVRQGGGEPVDVVALQDTPDAWPNAIFIQVKASSPYLAPAEREAFMLRAKAAGAVPMVAWRSKTSKQLEYKVLEGSE